MSHLAVAVLRHVVGATSARALFSDTRDLLRVIRSTYDPVVRTTEVEVLRPVMEADLLVLDDLGAEKTTEWVEETLNLIVNTRYNERRVTVFTSNYPAHSRRDRHELAALPHRLPHPVEAARDVRLPRVARRRLPIRAGERHRQGAARAGGDGEGQGQPGRRRGAPVAGARAVASGARRTELSSGVGPVTLWCAPSTDHPFFRRCAHVFNVELRSQSEGDLGRRMADAFQETLKGATQALLIGTDCPSLTGEDVRDAALVLRHKADAVMRPTEDGGYVLIGLRRLALSLFEGVPWGTEAVLPETRRRLRDLGWAWHELPVRWDVDRPEDVKRLIAEGYGAMIPDPWPG